MKQGPDVSRTLEAVNLSCEALTWIHPPIQLHESCYSHQGRRGKMLIIERMLMEYDNDDDHGNVKRKRLRTVKK